MKQRAESYVFPEKIAVSQGTGGGTRGPSSRPQTPTPFPLLCVPFWLGKHGISASLPVRPIRLLTHSKPGSPTV